MTSPLDVLDDLELDALTELVNIGVGRAAASFREMVGEQVHLSVPEVSLASRDAAIRVLDGGQNRKLIAVHQAFEGDIIGRALLIFPEAKSLELVRAITGGDLPLEDIIELEHEALAETGNIILNGCLSTIANMLRRTLRMSLPEILRGECTMFFSLAPPSKAADVVMLLYIDFAVQKRDITGHIVMLMDMPSLQHLRVLLQELIARETGDGSAVTDDAS
jgi:chemotaxis protein CheC